MSRVAFSRSSSRFRVRGVGSSFFSRPCLFGARATLFNRSVRVLIDVGDVCVLYSDVQLVLIDVGDVCVLYSDVQLSSA